MIEYEPCRYYGIYRYRDVSYKMLQPRKFSSSLVKKATRFYQSILVDSILVYQRGVFWLGSFPCFFRFLVYFLTHIIELHHKSNFKLEKYAVKCLKASGGRGPFCLGEQGRAI